MAYDNGDKFDEIVEKNRLRPINTKESLKASDYYQVQIALAMELYEWAKNGPESTRCLAEIRTKSNCLVISFDKEKKHILVVGKQENTETAKILIDVVLSHQLEVLQHCASSIEEDLPEKEYTTEVISVDENVFNLLGGIKGVYFEAIKAKYSIEFEPEITSAEGKCHISLIGASDKAIQLAKKDMLLALTHIVVPNKQAPYLKLRLKELQHKSKIVCTIESTTEQDTTDGVIKITAIGTDEALKNFRLAVETSLDLESKASEQTIKIENKVEEPPLHSTQYPYQKTKPLAPRRGTFGTVRYIKKT